MPCSAELRQPFATPPLPSPPSHHPRNTQHAGISPLLFFSFSPALSLSSHLLFGGWPSHHTLRLTSRLAVVLSVRVSLRVCVFGSALIHLLFFYLRRPLPLSFSPRASFEIGEGAASPSFLGWRHPRSLPPTDSTRFSLQRKANPHSTASTGLPSCLSPPLSLSHFVCRSPGQCCFFSFLVRRRRTKSRAVQQTPPAADVDVRARRQDPRICSVICSLCVCVLFSPNNPLSLSLSTFFSARPPPVLSVSVCLCVCVCVRVGRRRASCPRRDTTTASLIAFVCGSRARSSSFLVCFLTLLCCCVVRHIAFSLFVLDCAGLLLAFPPPPPPLLLSFSGG